MLHAAAQARHHHSLSPAILRQEAFQGLSGLTSVLTERGRAVRWMGSAPPSHTRS